MTGLVEASHRETQRWSTIVRRARDIDDDFVYGVRTTGIYCRPNCSSRKPRRENIEFFDTAADAEKAGFRPCKRCHPREDIDQRLLVVQAACRRIENSDRSPGLRELADDVGMSQSHFHRLFRSLSGVTPKEYSEAVKANRVREGLLKGEPVTSVMYRAGFSSSSRFYERSRRILGMLPASYKTGATGECICFALAQTTLGWVLVAATNQGVCSIGLGDQPSALRNELKARFPHAEIRQGDPVFRTWVGEVAARIDASKSDSDLPLDIRGTVFQRQVWSALQEIPPGETRTYAEIAGALGRPESTRAVANACAKNPIAVFVPCHRAIRGDGGLAGYRWGLERKRELLEREQPQHSQPK